MDKVNDIRAILKTGFKFSSFKTMFPFYNPLKTESRGFLMFSGGIERKHCPEISQ